MFRRIKESIRILSYKEEVIHPDAYEEGKSSYVEVSRAGRIIAGVISGAIAVLTGSVTYTVVDAVVPKDHLAVSSETASRILTAAFSLIAFWIFENVKNDFTSRLNLNHHLAPYFGHKIESALRIIKAKSI